MSAQEPTQVGVPPPPAGAPVITSQVKEKSPGRVAAGKRLAEISRVARERKKQEAAAAIHSDADNTLFTYSNIFALVGISIGAAALFYELRPKKVDPPPPVTVEIVPRKAPPLASGLESFD